MKIFFDNKCFLNQKYGGVSEYFHQLKCGLSEISDTTVKHGGIFNYYHVKSSAHFNISKPASRLTRLLDLSYVKLQNMANVPAIYHSTYYSTPKSKNKRTKYIVTFFDAMHEELPDYFPDTRKTLKLKHEAISAADGIICISNTSFKHLKKHYDVTNKLVRTIYLSCIPTVESRGVEYLENTKEKYILYVGGLKGYKNFSRFYKAFLASSLSDNYKVIIASPEKLEIEIYPIFNQRGDIIITPNSAELSNLYRSCSLFVYPSLMEGFGIPILEALHHGAPIICSNIGAFREIVGYHPDIMFDPYDEMSIRETLEKFGRGVRSKNILPVNDILPSFSQSKMVTETYDFYKELCSV